MASRISLQLDGLARRTKAVAIRNLKDCLNLLQTEVQKSLGKQGSRHNRSRPGEPPKKQTGQLQGGITTEINESRLEGKLRSTAPYAGYLESGTSKMKPRPYFAPAYKRLRVRITEILQRRK